MSPIACVRELLATLERGEALTEPIRSRLIAALRRVEREGASGLSLDAALGLSPSAWRQDKRRRRDELIRIAYDRYLGKLSIREAAKRIARLGHELQTGRMRVAASDTADDFTGILRKALRAGVAFPASARQVENILSGRAK